MMKRLVLVAIVATGFVAAAVLVRASSPSQSSKHVTETEREVSLSEIPEAVRATILQEAGPNQVLEVEETTADGRSFYEADWMVDGREFEVRVSQDGVLLDKGFDAEGDDEDDADGPEEDDRDN